MRTGKEMYQYCRNNKLGSSISKSWTIKHFDVIANNLNADEDVLMAFVGLHNHRPKELTGGKDENDGFYGYVITNKRFMLGQKKFIGESFHFIMLEHLNDVSLQTGMLSGIITIDTIKEKFSVHIAAKSEAQNIVRRLNEALITFKSATKQSSEVVCTPPSPSAIDEIRAFKQLMDDGIITANEFEAKKKQFLGLN